jgi:hypothetical protein
VDAFEGSVRGKKALLKVVVNLGISTKAKFMDIFN